MTKKGIIAIIVGAAITLSAGAITCAVGSAVDGVPFKNSDFATWFGKEATTTAPPKGDKGDKGDKGADGKDGDTPFIGANGNWFIGETDTGVRAAGADGQNGADGLNGTDGVNGQDGKDGDTPFIGANGNWFIGENDTGVCATGVDGQNGADGQDGKDGDTPYIGDNGNWFIGETDTEVKAAGTNGASGRAITSSGAVIFDITEEMFGDIITPISGSLYHHRVTFKNWLYLDYFCTRSTLFDSFNTFARQVINIRKIFLLSGFYLDNANNIYLPARLTLKEEGGAITATLQAFKLIVA